MTWKRRASQQWAASRQSPGTYCAELGAVPAAGRLLLPSDVDLEAFTPAAVAVIGHGFWQRRFGGSPAAIGAAVRIDDVPFTIVGVAPRGFKGFGLMVEPDVIVPLTAPGAGAPANYANAGLLWMRVAGRLAPGTSLDEARVQLEAVWPLIKADIIPPTHAGAQRETFFGLPLRLESLARGHEPYLQDFRIRVLALQGLALLAFLVGCLNLGSLTLRVWRLACPSRRSGRPWVRARGRPCATCCSKACSWHSRALCVPCRLACGRALPSRR